MNACTRPPPQTTETKTPTTAVVRRRTLETVESAHLDDEDDVEYLLEDDINESRDTEQEPDYDPNYSTRIKCHDSSGSSSKRTADETFGTSTFTGSVYGQPVSSSEATRLCPPPTADDVTSEGGFIYHAHLVSDEWAHPKDTDEDGTIKPRRPSLPVRQKDFFSSLVQTEDGRWLFSGVLNGWPGLTLLEVRSITCLANRSKWLGGAKIVRFWDASRKDKQPPSFPKGPKSVRVTLRAPSYTSSGWTKESKGFVWWYESRRNFSGGPRLSHGEDMITNITMDVEHYNWAMPIATTIHHFAHRYARPGKHGYETNKQKLTYHGAILLEWSHGMYCTVVELATLNGVGGRSGKANWYHDKNERNPQLYQDMPPVMIMPWKGKFAEIRVHDVESQNFAEFQTYVSNYTGPEKRFLDVHYIASSPVRLFSRSQIDIQRYLLNYMGRDRRYAEEYRNCQTFSADFYGFMAGKVGIVPFHKVNRVAYKNRSHNFLYSPELYGPPHRPSE